MQAVDTNVVVRILVEDDPVQSQHAIALWQKLLVHEGIYLSKVVIVETIWVLQRSYQFNRQQITAVIDLLLNTENISVEDIDQVREALKQFAITKADFSDFVIVESARFANALPLYTFDKRLGKSPGTQLID